MNSMILLGLLSEHMLKFIFSKKATKIDKIFTVDRRLLHSLKLTVKISSIFVTFLENMNFKRHSKPRLYVFSMDSISHMPCVIPIPRLLAICSGVKKSLF